MVPVILPPRLAFGKTFSAALRDDKAKRAFDTEAAFVGKFLVALSVATSPRNPEEHRE